MSSPEPGVRAAGGRPLTKQEALALPAEAPPVWPWVVYGAAVLVAIGMFFVYTPR
jgi:hypothetical protein